METPKCDFNDSTIINGDFAGNKHVHSTMRLQKLTVRMNAMDFPRCTYHMVESRWCCLNSHVGGSINGDTPKWMVYKGKYHLEMDDDWGYPYFSTPPFHYLLVLSREWGNDPIHMCLDPHIFLPA